MKMIITKLLPINNPLLLLRRCYGVAAKDVKFEMAAATRMVSESQSSAATNNNNNDNKNKDEIFWMRDPKSGNWIPENHFGEQVDAADLRAKFLSQQHNQHSNNF